MLNKHVMPGLAASTLAAMSGPIPKGIVFQQANDDGGEVGGLLGSIKAQIEQIGEANRKQMNNFEAKTRRDLDDLKGRGLALEQKVADIRPGSYGPAVEPSLGQQVVQSDRLKAWKDDGLRGTLKIEVNQAITSIAGSAGGLIRPDRYQDVVGLPRRRLTVRDLLGSGSTQSNMVEYAKQSTRTNNAAVQTEGALKAESALAWTLAEAPVRTIATWVPASRQALDDAPQLMSLVDNELRYMVDYAEEQEILYGSGVAPHLHGLTLNATAFSAPFVVSSSSMLDTVRQAIAQVQQSLYRADGIILNDMDWAEMQTIKDGEDRYIGGGPFRITGNTLWGLPVVDTPAMTAGHFMVGAFKVAAQIIDRMLMEVLISTENSDNFVKNMITIRAEKRVALATKIPAAMVYGTI